MAPSEDETTPLVAGPGDSTATDHPSHVGDGQGQRLVVQNSWVPTLGDVPAVAAVIAGSVLVGVALQKTHGAPATSSADEAQLFTQHPAPEPDYTLRCAFLTDEKAEYVRCGSFHGAWSDESRAMFREDTKPGALITINYSGTAAEERVPYFAQQQAYIWEMDKEDWTTFLAASKIALGDDQSKDKADAGDPAFVEQ